MHMNWFVPLAGSSDQQEDINLPLQESHYDYFHRRLPGEAPEHRKAMQWKTDIARKFHKHLGMLWWQGRVVVVLVLVLVVVVVVVVAVIAVVSLFEI